MLIKIVINSKLPNCPEPDQILVEGHLNPGLFNHEFLSHGFEKFMVEKSGVEKSGGEMSFNLLER